MKKYFWVFITLLYTSALLAQEPDTTDRALHVVSSKGKLTFNGYFDFIYAAGVHDPNRALGTDFGRRQYTSSPLFSDKFTMPYAYLGMTYQVDKLTLRLALHEGDIVESLYVEELQSMRIVREASVNYQFTKKFSVEAGVFPSLYGFEIFLSKENLHATRAYIADFAPDYEAGVRLKYQLNDKWSVRLMLLNGWQEIKDANGKKALGFVGQYDNKKNSFFNLGIYLGDVRQVAEPFSRHRVYHNIFWRYKMNRWTFVPMLDFAVQLQEEQSNEPIAMTAPAMSIRYAIDKDWAIASRWDMVMDPNNMIPELNGKLITPSLINTINNPNGWQSNSVTLTLERILNNNLTVRMEGRYALNKDKLFLDGPSRLVNYDGYVLVSMAANF